MRHNGSVDPRAERSRRAAIDAALEILGREGIDGLTHTRLSEAAGLSRRTLHRHWPSRPELVRDVLAAASFPSSERSDDVEADVRRHLRELRDALTTGPLATIVGGLAERAATDPGMRRIRDDLGHSGSEPLRDRLSDAGFCDADALVARLEGPIFYEVLVRGRTPRDEHLDDLADSVLSARRPQTPA